MDSEQLKKINELVEKMERIDNILRMDERHKLLISQAARVDFDWQVLDFACMAFRNNLKAELKELGYEE